MKSVLLVTHYFPAHGGGVERVAGELATRLAASGAATIEWYASATDAAPAIPGVTAHPVRAWNGTERRLGVPYPLWSLSGVAAVRRTMERVDVVHLHDALYLANFLAGWTALRRHKRLVITQHIGFIPYRNPMLRVLLSIANRCVAAPLLRRADRVVFISPVVRAYFERFGALPRAVDVANGVDNVRFAPAADAVRAALRQRLSIAHEQPVLLFVGRHVERKGLPLLRQLAERTPQWSWVLIGTGPIDPGSWRLPNVRALGVRTQDELADWYRCADLLVLPSVGEGFPLVVQEALSCGLKCVLDPESIAAGRLPPAIAAAEPAQGDDAAERWLRRLRDELVLPPEQRAAARAQAAAFARSRWSWDAVADAYRDALLGT